MGDKILTFDQNGYVSPYDIVEIEWQIFVDIFSYNSHRQKICFAYEGFVNDLSKLLPITHRHWIGGSFVSRKEEPGDIDVVVFIPHSYFSTIVSDLKEMKSKALGLVDCYFVETYPVNHPKFEISRADELDWYYFLRTDRRKRPKVFLKYGMIMEINDELEIQIFHILEQVKRMNEAIRRHQRGDDPNGFMIEQFQEVKGRLTDELRSLLSQATEMRWQVAA